MHPSPFVFAAPRWTRAVLSVSLVVAAAAAAKQVMRGPALPFTQPTLPNYRGLHFPPIAPLRGGEGDDEKARKAFADQFAAAEDVVKHCDEKSSGDLRNARQILTDLELTDTARFGADYPDRIKELKSKLDDALVKKLCSEAKELAAATGTTARQGLAKYADAEDFVRKALLNAKQAESANHARYEETYKQLLVESDEYSKRVITKEFMESTPWKDLLDADMAGKWSKTTTVPGFGCRIESGVLTVTPPDAGTKMQGVCAVLDQQNENLRHFMLDMEFAIDGAVTVFFHATPPPQDLDSRQSETYELNSREGALSADERYSLVATCIGSDLAISFPRNDRIPRWENSPNWTKLRRGGIAFLIPEGTRLTVTRMRIRILR